MIGHIKMALGAALLLGATQAEAAKFLVVDISATGSGLRTQNVGPTVQTYAFTNYYASLSYNLENAPAPRIDGNTLLLIGANSSPSVSGTFKEDGFSFRAIGPNPRSGFSVIGNACFANSSPTTVTVGSPTLDASCSSIAVSNNSGSSTTLDKFDGVVTGINFRVVEADGLPGITLAIPEPSTWALMLAGFGMVGYSLRRRRYRAITA